MLVFCRKKSKKLFSTKKLKQNASFLQFFWFHNFYIAQNIIRETNLSFMYGKFYQHIFYKYFGRPTCLSHFHFYFAFFLSGFTCSSFINSGFYLSLAIVYTFGCSREPATEPWWKFFVLAVVTFSCSPAGKSSYDIRSLSKLWELRMSPNIKGEKKFFYESKKFSGLKFFLDWSQQTI